MSSASKHKVKYSTLPKLMWGKFAYVVAIHNPNGSWVFRDQHNYRVGRISNRSLVTLMNACPDDAEIFKLTKSRSKTWKFYFVNKANFDHFCEVVSSTCRSHIAEIMQPSSADQLDTLRTNGLVVYREHWFHNDYEWKVTFKDDLGETVIDEIQQWIHQSLADENDAYRYKIRSTRHTLIFYLKHDQAYHQGDSGRTSSIYQK